MEVTDEDSTLTSQQRYLPFGGVRGGLGPITQTDYGYTGQRDLGADVGLMDYKARFYSPYLNRFVQPDTLIPNAANPQAFNRYTYVMNSPVNFTDPTGHIIDRSLYAGDSDLTFSQVYGIKFTGDFSKNGWGNFKNMGAVIEAVKKVGEKLAESVGGTSAEAFKKVYGLNDGDTFQFEWDKDCWGCRKDPTGCDAGTTKGDACTPGFGYTNTENWIEFASMSDVEVPLRNINNVIHELGHAFNLRLGRTPENTLSLRSELLVNEGGFYGDASNRTWEASSGTNGSETFADQFLGWTYGNWETDYLGPVRADFMNKMNGSNGWVAWAASLP